MIRTQIQLTEAQSESLKKMARRQRTSIAALIRSGVDEIIRSGGELTREEQVERARAAAGKFHSGKKDLARRHDEYLIESFEK